MNYTDRFFKILIRLTDEYKLMQLQAELDKNTTLPETAPVVATVDSLYCIEDYTSIISYQEMYPPEVKFDDLGSKGFSCTLVQILRDRQLETVLCSWDIKKFEDKLNKHVAKLEAENIHSL